LKEERKMKTLILTIITLLVGTLLFSQTPEILVGEIFWNHTYEPFVVDQIIPAGDSLVIRPGVVLEFENAKLIVEGQLFARGSEANPIVFRSTTIIPDHMPAADIPINTPSFNGIEFRGVNGSLLNHVHISGVIHSTAIAIMGKRVDIWSPWTPSSNITISNSTITKCKSVDFHTPPTLGLLVENSNNITITKNKLIDLYNLLPNDTTSRRIVHIDNSRSVLFSDNEISYSTSMFIFRHSISNQSLRNDFIFHGNTVKNNTIRSGSVQITGANNTYLYVTDNHVLHNKNHQRPGTHPQGSPGLYISGSNEIVVTGNNISNNHAYGNNGGSGLSVINWSSSAYIIGNTISYNKASGFSGLAVDNSTNINIISENIIHNNSIHYPAHHPVNRLSSFGNLINFYKNILYDNIGPRVLDIDGNSNGNVKIVNCVIAHNQATGIHSFSRSPNIEIINTILWTNSVNQITQAADGAERPPIHIKHCSIEGGLATIFGNFTHTAIYYIDPLFIDIEDGNFCTEYDFTGYGYGNGINGYADYIGVFAFADSNLVHVRDFSTGFHWVSFPRLPRDHTTNEGVYSDIVLPTFGTNIDVIHHKEKFHSAYPSNSFIDIDFKHFYSSSGYKMRVIHDFTHRISGTTLNHDTQVTLAQNSANWVGYFLPYTQSVLAAIPDDIYEHIEHIYTQRGSVIFQNGVPLNITRIPTVSYGEMIEIKTNTNGDVNFTWNQTQNVVPIHRPVTSLFTFEENFEYLPIFVENDTDNPPDEIAVLINGVCVGASVYEGEFTEILAYLEEEHFGEEIEIVFGYKSGKKSSMSDFAVVNSITQSLDYVRLIPRRGVSYYHVKFESDKNSETIPPFIQLQQNFPNPFNPVTQIDFYLSHDENITLSIYNIRGQLVRELYSGDLSAGKHTLTWDGVDSTYKPVSSGIYLYRLNTTNDSIIKKMTLIK
jgi:hypothetical protein